MKISKDMKMALAITAVMATLYFVAYFIYVPLPRYIRDYKMAHTTPEPVPTPSYYVEGGRLYAHGYEFSPMKLDVTQPLYVRFNVSSDGRNSLFIAADTDMGHQNEFWFIPESGKPVYLGDVNYKNISTIWLSEDVFMINYGSIGVRWWHQTFYRIDNVENPRDIDDTLWFDAKKGLYVSGKDRMGHHLLELGYIFEPKKPVEQFEVIFDKYVPSLEYYGDVTVTPEGKLNYKFEYGDVKVDKLFDSKILAEYMRKGEGTDKGR